MQINLKATFQFLSRPPYLFVRDPSFRKTHKTPGFSEPHSLAPVVSQKADPAIQPLFLRNQDEKKKQVFFAAGGGPMNCVLLCAFVLLMPLHNSMASDWGCECLLCMSNPGGAWQYDECRPPMDKLIEHLREGGSFPDCKQSDGTSVATVKTTEGFCPRLECFEAYGPEWELASRYVCEENRKEGCTSVTQYYCRKFIKRVQEEVCNESGDRCSVQFVNKYEERAIASRAKPYYIDILYMDTANGEWVKSKRFWFSKNGVSMSFCSGSGPTRCPE